MYIQVLSNVTVPISNPNNTAIYVEYSRFYSPYLCNNWLREISFLGQCMSHDAAMCVTTTPPFLRSTWKTSC